MLAPVGGERRGGFGVGPDREAEPLLPEEAGPDGRRDADQPDRLPGGVEAAEKVRHLRMNVEILPVEGEGREVLRSPVPARQDDGVEFVGVELGHVAHGSARNPGGLGPHVSAGALHHLSPLMVDHVGLGDVRGGADRTGSRPIEREESEDGFVDLGAIVDAAARQEDGYLLHLGFRCFEGRVGEGFEGDGTGPGGREASARSARRRQEPPGHIRGLDRTMTIEQTYFRRGFGLKEAVRPVIEAEYHSAVVEQIRARGYTSTFGDVTVRLAEEFGFCYGVDRAVDYAYETRKKFPDKTVYLVGEIIHNPHVNRRMKEMGIEFLYPDAEGLFDFSPVREEDVVLLPAFGVTIEAFEELRAKGCVLVDTTCGSVLLVWKRVEGYARDGFTAIIHGKYTHEESRATASQVRTHPQGKYLIVRDMDEARLVCDYIARRPGHLSREAFMDHFREKASPGFDPDRDLERFGVANQTTMLANESMAIGRKLEEALLEARGPEYVAENYRSFGTICSATQERQDAVVKMMADPPDIMIVIGGYNSSNTNHLAHMCREHTRTFHIEDSSCIDVEGGTIRHKPEIAVEAPEVTESGWLPAGPFELGLTAGASTPNNKIGDALLRILEIRGIRADAPTT